MKTQPMLLTLTAILNLFVLWVSPLQAQGKIYISPQVGEDIRKVEASKARFEARTKALKMLGLKADPKDLAPQIAAIYAAAKEQGFLEEKKPLVILDEDGKTVLYTVTLKVSGKEKKLDSIAIISNRSVVTIEGDTSKTEVEYEEVVASPDGRILSGNLKPTLAAVQKAPKIFSEKMRGGPTEDVWQVYLASAVFSVAEALK